MAVKKRRASSLPFLFTSAIAGIPDFLDILKLVGFLVVVGIAQFGTDNDLFICAFYVCSSTWTSQT